MATFIINITAKHYIDGHNGYSDYASYILLLYCPANEIIKRF